MTTRSRRRSSTPRAAAEPVPVVVAEPVVEPVAEPEPVVEEPVVEAPPAPPEPPKVITRTRGRAATRPAGPPVEVASRGAGRRDR